MDKLNDIGNVYLVGLMGAGKTTVGRMLAKRLNLDFVDSDREIEARTGVSIPTIFEIEGEDGFRNREAQVIAALSMQGGQVVATGGGAVLLKENRDNMRKSGFVVFLNASPYVLMERTRHDRNRPLLQVADPLKKLTELLSHRDQFYREVAHLVVDNGRVNTQTLLQMLIKGVEEHWKR